ncbi:MAG: hypothetical protein RL701_527 [Pseudomonadota bacterium]
MIELHTSPERRSHSHRSLLTRLNLVKISSLLIALTSAASLTLNACAKDDALPVSTMNTGGSAGQKTAGTPDVRAGAGAANGGGGRGGGGSGRGAAGAATGPAGRGSPAGHSASAAGGTGGDTSGADAGSDSAAGAGGSDMPAVVVPSVDTIGIASELGKAACTALRDCLGGQKLQAYVGRESCETLFTQTLTQVDLASLDESVRRGRVKLNKDVLAKCYEDTAALGCRFNSERLPASCQQAIQGQVQAGGTCSIGSDCGGNTFCSAGECPRVCTPRFDEGTACTNDDQCVSGVLCLAGKCAKYADVGAACAGESNGVCALGTSCVGSSTTASGTCKANRDIQVGEQGGPCDFGGTLCREGLSCAYDGSNLSCQAGAESGGACRPAAPQLCPSTEYCSERDVAKQGSCLPLPAEGETCVLGNECAAGFVCLADVAGKPVCRQIRNLGEACSQDGSCRSAHCVNAVCAAKSVCD